MSIDFEAITRINKNLQLRGLKEADAGDKAVNEQTVQEFLQTNRQTLIELSQAEINTEQPDAATIEWMNKLIRLADTLTTQFGDNIVNNLNDPDNGTTGVLYKHDGGSMSLTLHDSKWTATPPSRPLDDFLVFTVNRTGEQLTISVTGNPKGKNMLSGRSLEINTRQGQAITTSDIKLTIVDTPTNELEV